MHATYETFLDQSRQHDHPIHTALWALSCVAGITTVASVNSIASKPDPDLLRRATINLIPCSAFVETTVCY